MKIDRRTLLSTIAALSTARPGWTASQKRPESLEAFLSEMAVPRAVIDEFLDPREPNWAVFDSEIGYRHGDTVKKDGIDGSYCIYRMEPSGERKRVNFGNRPCRINTYGDSFTHCDQVSDGETWQEYLASHFGEPLRNYGTGGYGVYQAYRRMLREESTAASAPFILFNIWIDDHRRSLMSARWLHIRFFRDLIQSREATHYFHANPWCHVRFDPNGGKLIEYENSNPDPDSLYNFCDPEYLVETYRDDLYVQMEFAIEGGTPPKLEEMRHLASLLDMTGDWNSPEAIASQADRLFWHSGMKASEEIARRALDFAQTNKKELLFLVSYRSTDIMAACKNVPRLDQPFIDFLRQSNIRFIDSLVKHEEDFRQFQISPEDYIRRYYNGHYSPMGNHFFAYAIKDELLNWLDPVPFTYRSENPSIADISAILAR